MEELKTLSYECICTHLGDEYEKYSGAVVPPIFQNSLHVFPTVEAKEAFDSNREEGRYFYGRVSNPTVEIVERKIAALERGDAAKCFGSGMAAISSALLSCLSAGDHVIAVKNVYGPTNTFLTEYMSRFNIETSFVKGDKVSEFEDAIRKNTTVIYLESPTSFNMMLQDLKGVACLAKKHNITTIIDNTWCTPIFQKPLELGIDIVVHTLSKYYGGHSDVIGGVVVSRKDIIDRIASQERELLGGILHPFEAWLVLRGIRTLPVRLRQHQENAMKVAQFLENHPKVSRVYYPGLPSHPQYELGRKQMKGYSGLMSFELKTTPEKLKQFVNSLKMFKIGVSWGGFESLVIIPCASWSDEQCEEYGLSKTMVRIAVGLEDADELIKDLSDGLAAI